MKLQSKDDIIYRLMIALKRDARYVNSNTEEDIINSAINHGWIDALEWVLNINDCFNEEKIKEEDNG